jgi:nicotinamide riboside transporter PnuC
MTFMDIFPWVVSVLSLVGVVLNIKKSRICFFIWLFTNASWTIVDFVFGLYAQSLLFLVYTGLAVYGIIEWRKK